MKRALLFILTLMLAVIVASPALAIDWSATGAINILNAFYKNMDERYPIYLGGPPGMNDFGFGVGAADPAFNQQNWWLQNRLQLFITARASQDLYGTIGFEIDSHRWGEAEAVAGTNTAHTIGKWNADAIAITVKTMFIDFKVPNAPVWFRVGIQPYILRPWVTLCDDAAGISSRIALKAGDVKIGINPFWAVMSKGGWATTLGGPFIGTVVPGPATDQTTADDANLFGIDVNAATGPIKGGLYFIYQNRPKRYDTALGEGDSKQWWIGPYVDVKAGPLAVTWDFVFNGGYEDWQNGTITVFERGNPLRIYPPTLLTPQGWSRRHQGWLTRGEASYTINKFRFGMGWLYGTGDDPTTTDVDEGYNVNFNGETAPVQRDFLIVGGDWGLNVPFGATTTIIGFYKPWSSYGQGIWHVRGFADYQVTEWLKLLANTGYIGDTVKHGDQFGRDANDDDSIGWEIDVAAQIKIYRNLTLSSAFGYLIGGKALSTGGGARPQDPWAWVTSLSYVF